MPLIDCPVCHRQVSAAAATCPSCGHPIRPPIPPVAPTTISIDARNPGIAAILSLLLPGVGQMYVGDITRGILWLGGVTLGYLACILPGIVLHIWCVFDAAEQARSANNSQL